MRLWVEPDVIAAIRDLPGHIRQRVRRAISDLAMEVRPPQSRALTIPADLLIPGIEARRLRIEQWRVIDLIDQERDLVSVLAVRQRPPSTYDNLHELLGQSSDVR